MNWSPDIRSSAGTNITLQIAFLILLAWIGIADDPAGGPAGAFASMAFILLVFVGVTKPEKPVHELFEAIAAPLINAGSALALMAVFGLGSLLWNPILMFVGIFIYFAARAEEHQAAVSGYAYRLTVRDAMEHSPGVLDEGQPVSEAIDALLASPQRDFPVADSAHHIVGLLDRDAMILGLRDKGASAPVGEVMRACLPLLAAITPARGLRPDARGRRHGGGGGGRGEPRDRRAHSGERRRHDDGGERQAGVAFRATIECSP